MKLIDPIFKLTTFQKETINTSNQFQSSATEYTSKFKKMHKYPKSSRFCIYNKIKSVIPLTVIKYGNRHQLSNIFDTLVTNGTYLNLNTFSTHEEHSIGFFIHISLKITLRNNFRNTIQDELIQIDLDNEEGALMIHEIKDSAGKPTGKQKIVVPTSNLYSKEIGGGNINERVTTFVYEI